MKLLADQNMHRRLVVRLREAGYDVEFISETMPGRLDPEILARLDIGELIFLTGDKGFGNWIFNLGLPRPYAVLLDRCEHSAWASTAERLLVILERGIEPGQMVTINKDGERAKPFPLGVQNA